jgi:hypothetical protein
MDKGMVHDSQLSTSRFPVCSGDCRISASEQSTSAAIVCECSNMFACCSICLSPGRRSDLQAHHTSFELGKQCCPLGIEHDQPSSFIMEKAMRAAIALSFALLVIRPAISSAEDQTATVGPWTIATSSKADKFDSCMMSRSTDDLNASFVRTDDGLLLLLNSSKWRLERGKTYSVSLIAGSRSVDAEALAESRGVTIALADRPFKEAMRTANVLEIRGEGATLRVPLDGSSEAFRRLETCFGENSRQTSDTNPFVAPSRAPASQAQNDERKARNGVVKCYRTMVVGRYRCHHFY